PRRGHPPRARRRPRAVRGPGARSGARGKPGPPRPCPRRSGRPRDPREPRESPAPSARPAGLPRSPGQRSRRGRSRAYNLGRPSIVFSRERHGTMDRATDAVVIGGGLTGLATAALLGRRGLAVTIVEKAEQPGEHTATTEKSG